MRVRVLACWAVVAIAVAGIAARARRAPVRRRGRGRPARPCASASSPTRSAGAPAWAARSRWRGQTGARWLREEIDWGERRAGPRRAPLGATDRLFVAAAHRGLRVLPLLNGTPRWAVGRDGALPTDAHAYAAFVARRGRPLRAVRQLLARPSDARRAAGAGVVRALERAVLRAAQPQRDHRAALRGARRRRRSAPAAPPTPTRASCWRSTRRRRRARAGRAAGWTAWPPARPGLLAAADGVAAHPYAADGAAVAALAGPPARSADRARPGADADLGHRGGLDHLQRARRSASPSALRPPTCDAC